MRANSCVVIDVGSQCVKAGFADTFPKEQEPHIIVENAVVAEEDIPQALEYDDALKQKVFYIHSMKKGVLSDVDALEVVIGHVLYGMCGWIQGAEEHVVMVEPILTSKLDRERMAQVMFETFNLSTYFVTDAAVASLYSVGKTGGIVVDVGFEKIDVAPVLEGVMHPSVASRVPVGGKHMTDVLMDVLNEEYGCHVSFHEAEEIKVGACRHGMNEESYEYTLPDGQKINVVDQLSRVKSRILEPSSFGLDVPSLAESCIHASMVTTVHGERDSRKTLMENVFMCGGGSGVPDLSVDLLKQISSRAHASLTPGLCQVPEHMPQHTGLYSSWFGGSVIGSVIYNQANAQIGQQAVTKGEYHEYGPSAVHRHCS
eukprot:jgi/Picre1/28774/NNA_004172.t1